MKKIELKTVFIEYNSLDELTQDDRGLVLLAKEAADTAYAPYSKFHVGAALKLENGVCIKGSNQENVAYPSGLCAERVAIFSASSQYPGIPVNTIAITAKTDSFKVDSPITPCGSCRQVLAEYERLFKKPIRVILTGETGSVYVIDKIEDLLPLSFKADKLKK
ncbi:MAG: cytidine deaminase [Bacteroidetes bacterium]|nr:cytidine deaminase [Bacteroidota bacterium]